MRTPVCDLLGIEAPIVQGSFGPWTTAELTAAVSNAGALGSVGTALLDADRVRALIARVRDLTDRPFAVNFTARPLVEEVFAAALAVQPAVVSYALAEPGELVKRAHDAGALFMQQVHTVDQGHAAAEMGVDVIIAQGSEAGGFGGTVGALTLIPQVVEVVAPVPVLAAGGIADGRGLAVALLLGAQGANIGTRFLASVEAGVDASWKQRIVDSASEETVKVEAANTLFSGPPAQGYEVSPRVLRTTFVDEWNARSDADGTERRDELQAEFRRALSEARAHELVPFTGQTVGLIEDVVPVAEIVRRLVSEAEELLRRAPAIVA